MNKTCAEQARELLGLSLFLGGAINWATETLAFGVFQKYP